MLGKFHFVFIKSFQIAEKNLTVRIPIQHITTHKKYYIYVHVHYTVQHYALSATARGYQLRASALRDERRSTAAPGRRRSRRRDGPRDSTHCFN